MKLHIQCMILFVCLVLLSTVACAQSVPTSFTYQGKVTDANSQPLPDGLTAMQFRLFDAESLGVQLWDSGALNVGVKGGLFSVVLGASPTPPITSVTLSSDSIWLEIAIGISAPLPRIKLHSAPFALRAEVAESVSDNIITSEKIKDGEVKSADLGQNSVISDKIQDGTILFSDLSVNGASANQIIKRNASNTAWILAPDDNTTYSAGTGLSLSGTIFSLNPSYMSDNYWVLGGNSDTEPSLDFIGTSDNIAFEVKVNNNRALRIEPTLSTPNLLGGYHSNTIMAGVEGAFIGGGGNPNDTGSRKFNNVTDHFGTIGGGVGNTAGNNDAILDNAKHATVAGGQYNEATASIATVGGGWYNRATYERATVGGGWSNLASNHASTVGGGRDNIASGSISTVPGGASNRAQGSYSFAAGRRAKADHQGTFVWADSTDIDFLSTANNQFLVRASGGVGIGVNNPQATLDIGGLARVQGTIWPASGHGMELGYSSSLNRGYLQVYNRDSSTWGDLYMGDGSVGIGISPPEAKLHVLSTSGNSGKAVYGKVTNPPGFIGYGVYGEASYTDGRGVYGLNVTNNSFGYLGGSSQGAHGESATGNYGYLGGTDRGAYGRHSSGNEGSLGGSTYGVKSVGNLIVESGSASVAGDLTVTGAYKGNIGPNNGAPFPRPAYDSGWITIAPDAIITLNHNIGINTNSYLVDMQLMDISYYGITNIDLGGNTYPDNDSWVNKGTCWRNLTSTSITVTNYDDSSTDKVRVRIWVCN